MRRKAGCAIGKEKPHGTYGGDNAINVFFCNHNAAAPSGLKLVRNSGLFVEKKKIEKK